MSMSNDVEASIIAIIAPAAETEAGEITRETELAELEIDSLVLTEVVMDIEDKYDIEIDMNTAEAWESLKTVGDIVDVVKALSRQRPDHGQTTRCHNRTGWYLRPGRQCRDDLGRHEAGTGRSPAPGF
jgi:nodulation protein F